MPSRTFDLVVFFQQLIRDKTNADVDFINGPRRGLTFKAAKNLLVFTGGDIEKATAIIEEWAKDPWEIEHNPDNLMRVYQCANKLLAQLAKKEAKAPTATTIRKRDLSLYRL
jgi:hypothetical protein